MNSKQIQKNWLAIAALVVLSMAVVADASVSAYTGPSWRGGPGTTFERWSFSSDSTSPSPDSYNNPYGAPSLWIGDRATWSQTIDTYANVWALKTDEMDLQIPNRSATWAGTEKHIWAEITWKVAGLDTRTTHDDSLMVGVDPEGGYTAMNFKRQDDSIGNGWFSTIIKVNIKPNPLSEWIFVKGDIYIDEVTIDTQCIPEPATLGLLIGGAIMAIRRKLKV
jgi:hypothetical protein